jgi:two-component system CheB/CheR fusion protein
MVKKPGSPKKTRSPRGSVPPLPSPPDVAAPSDDRRTDPAFQVVGVGASAGGMEAIGELLRELPRSPGFAVVVIQHLDPHHESVLSQILGRQSQMPVEEVTDGVVVEPNRVYVIPSNADVTMRHGQLHLTERVAGVVHMAIDTFFRSLADDQGSLAIGVILSGSASDGALGSKSIKAEGGITFAQDDTAQFNSMPLSAIANGSIDFVLPPREIAHELVRISHHSYLSGDGRKPARLPHAELMKLFAILESAHEIDFTHYKPSTVERRIRRRMAVHKIEELSDYLEFLRSDRREVEQLNADILIRVTSFFRDSDVFEALKSIVGPALMKGRDSEAPLRVWVPGCATGEEVYSVAIIMLELMEANGGPVPIQIFGTDVSESAIERARAGIYPENIAADVSAERLRRFFTKSDGFYRVSKTVRDTCVFARQNLTKDPPFSRLDLISCRNVLIYLGSVLQRKVMTIFHYALRPEGYLLLGSSETIGGFTDLFAIVERKHKVYQKKGSGARAALDLEVTAPARPRLEKPAAEEEQALPTSLFREADRVAVARYSPAGVLINDQLEILQFRGRTSPFLEPAPGSASFNILKMAREGLLAELRTAIHNARKTEQPVRRSGLRITNGGGESSVTIEVLPFVTGLKERYHLVLFEESPLPPQPVEKTPKKSGREKETPEAERLRRELEATREYLQSIIEEQESMNEELRSANEEIQSSNEELQSTNEELETAKEELQSTNEELTTLNEELETRNDELAQANNDLVNLLSSVDIPIIMLDNGMRIRRFNPGAQRLLNMIPADAGRLLSDLKTPLQIDNLEALIAEVVDLLIVRELEVQDRKGHWYSLRIRPYKTMENKIEGAVLVLVDIDELKKRQSGR